MKKVLTIIMAAILLLQTLSVFASYCDISPDGNHVFFYYKDSLHMPDGHRYHRICEECAEDEFLSYEIKYDCCQCVGHSYSTFSTPSTVHTDFGHLVTRTCTRCSYVQYSYVSDYSCCECTGNHNTVSYVSDVHTTSGHGIYHECMDCHEVFFAGYTVKDGCCQCGFHALSAWSNPSSAHTSSGHLESRTCSKCTYSETRYVYDSSCCECTGNHCYIAYVSNVHTSSGHAVTETCSCCQRSRSAGYINISDCCCGIHQFCIWQTSEVHTESGHLQSRYCQKCGKTENRYIYDSDCCECTGNHCYIESVSSIHTSTGHAMTKICTCCLNSQLIGYVTVSECCCGFHQFSAWLEAGIIHTSDGHLQSRTCQECGKSENRYVALDTCCLCQGHVMGNRTISPEHTEAGHLETISCINCDYEEIFYVNDFDCSLCHDQPGDTEEFILWLQSKGIPHYSSFNLYPANYDTYVRYGLIVYGSSLQVASNEYAEGEYRYLGFTYLNELYTNLYFPDDATSGIIPELWNYVAVNGATESYDLLEQTVQRPYMLMTPLTGHGATTLTADDIGVSKAKVQSGATWSSAGSIYTEKDTGYYATFLVPSMGNGTLMTSMTASKSIIMMDSGTQSEEITITLTAQIDKPSCEISYIRAAVEDDDKTDFVNVNSIVLTKTVTIFRPEGEYAEFIFTGTIEAESLFKDRLEKQVSCSVKVYVTADTPIDPIIVPEPEPEPDPEPDPDPVIPAEITSIVIEEITLYGAYNHWKKGVDIFEEPLLYNEHRFLSLERIYLHIKAEGVKSIVIRLSPELEAMSYENSSGHVYDYNLDFDIPYVYFPAMSTFVFDSDENIDFTFSYILPMCEQTLDFYNQRIRNPYYISICFMNEDETVMHTISDIEMTGNIYDMIYPQPA